MWFSFQAEIWKKKITFACVSVSAADYCLMKDFKTTLAIGGISKLVVGKKKSNKKFPTSAR